MTTGLQVAFAQNWLESTGEILVSPETYPMKATPARESPGMVVISAPSPARSSKARVLFQVLLASARKSIDINSPYFLPDESARRELETAVARGVRVRIITPGDANNHPMARRASRRRYGELLQAGVKIYEYQPGMIHAKILMIDGQWAVVGSTNFDSRSFDLNDEVNVAVRSDSVVARLSEDFANDLNDSLEITYDAWQSRSWTERLLALGTFFLERQD
jgi:cardiolipin synthase